MQCRRRWTGPDRRSQGRPGDNLEFKIVGRAVTYIRQELGRPKLADRSSRLWLWCTGDRFKAATGGLVCVPLRARLSAGAGRAAGKIDRLLNIVRFRIRHGVNCDITTYWCQGFFGGSTMLPLKIGRA